MSATALYNLSDKQPTNKIRVDTLKVDTSIELVGTFVGNPEFSGDIQANSFQPTANANQDNIENMRTIFGDVLSTGTTPDITREIYVTRVGRIVNCTIQARPTSVATGAGGPVVFNLADIGSFTADDYEPKLAFSCVVPMDIGSATLSMDLSGVITLRKNVGTASVDFVNGDAIGWANAITFSYLANV